MAVNCSTGYAAALLGGQGFASIFHNSVIEVRTGPQPVTADAAATGLLVGRITRDGGPFSPGAPENGLQFSPAGRMMVSHPAHLWFLSGDASGTATWFRLLGNAPDTGDYSLSAPRIDGAIGTFATTGDIQLRMTTNVITAATQIPINQWFYGIPPLGE